MRTLSLFVLLGLVSPGCDSSQVPIVLGGGHAPALRDTGTYPDESASDPGDVVTVDGPPADARLSTDGLVSTPDHFVSDALSPDVSLPEPACREDMTMVSENLRSVPPLGGMLIGSRCTRCKLEEFRIAGDLLLFRELFLESVGPREGQRQGTITLRTLQDEEGGRALAFDLGTVLDGSPADLFPLVRGHDLVRFGGGHLTFAWNLQEPRLNIIPPGEIDGLGEGFALPWEPLHLRAGALAATEAGDGYVASIGPGSFPGQPSLRVHAVGREGRPEDMARFDAPLGSEEFFSVLGWRPFPDLPIVEQVEMSWTRRQGPIVLVHYATGGPIEGAPFEGLADAFTTAGELVWDGGIYWSGLQKAAWSVDENPLQGACLRLRSDSSGLFWVFRTMRSCDDPAGVGGCPREQHRVVRVPVGEPGVLPAPPTDWETVSEGIHMFDAVYAPDDSLLMLGATDAPAGQRRLVVVRVGQAGAESTELELASEAIDLCGYAWEWQEGTLELSPDGTVLTALAGLAYRDRSHDLPAFSELRRFSVRVGDQLELEE